MPNIKSAKKRVKTSEQRRVRNRAIKRELNTQRRMVLESLNRGDVDASRPLFNAYCSVLDKAVKKGVITANRSDRSKSRIAIRLNV